VTCFPAYAFLMCAPPGRQDECVSAFREHGLEASVVGVIDDSGLVALRSSGQRAVVIDLAVTEVTGLSR